MSEHAPPETLGAFVARGGRTLQIAAHAPIRARAAGRQSEKTTKTTIATRARAAGSEDRRGSPPAPSAAEIDSRGAGHHVWGMTLPVPVPAFPDAEIAALAARHARAGRGAMALLNRLGGKMEGQLKQLPGPVQNRVLALTQAALEQSYGLAATSGRLGRIGGGGHMALAGLSGAAGGLGGLPSALAELPVTVTLILRAIQEVAREHGFDPADEAVRRETLRVFAAGGPGEADDGVNTSFLGARLTLTGPALHRMVAAVAPRIAAALGQKLAAQAVPVLGAVAGAGLNLAFVRYYREIAHIRFGLLRLAQAHDPEKVARAFARAATVAPVLR